MKQTICDNCGAVIKENFTDYRCDLDANTMLIMDIKPILLNMTIKKIASPDICRDCIIRALQDKI